MWGTRSGGEGVLGGMVLIVRVSVGRGVGFEMKEARTGASRSKNCNT